MNDRSFFDVEVEAALTVLRNGGVILYPTDTIWGLGCDATDPAAVKRIYELKQRSDAKSLVILLADERDVNQYVAAPDPAVFDFIEAQERPTTIIFDHALGLAPNVTAADGSVAIRLVRDEFCRHLIKRLRKPIVSTSANISGSPAPASFAEVAAALRSGADHVVAWRQDDETPARPSQIIRWKNDGTTEVIRP